MHIVFVSNYFNHHQAPLSQALHEMTRGGYRFIATEPMSEERKSMGWGVGRLPEYVLLSHASREAAVESQRLIDEADVALIGSAPLALIANRLKAGKLTFLYAERLYKQGYEAYKLPKRLVAFYLKFGRHARLYLLCASAYAAADFAKTRTFLNKAYQWGYFPETREYDDIERMIAQKAPGTILWTGRLIDWKHPDMAVRAAARLRDAGYDFELSVIGNGAMDAALRQAVADSRLQERVRMLGPMRPEQVREQMERSEIFLLTSDRNEGWGAVLNEAMNSGCAVVASHAAGASPYLVRDQRNGLIFRDGDLEDLLGCLRRLLEDGARRRALGARAYETIAGTWNARTAAARLIGLCEALLGGEARPDLFADGPCAKAAILRDDWYTRSAPSL